MYQYALTREIDDSVEFITFIEDVEPLSQIGKLIGEVEDDLSAINESCDEESESSVALAAKAEEEVSKTVEMSLWTIFQECGASFNQTLDDVIEEEGQGLLEGFFQDFYSIVDIKASMEVGELVHIELPWDKELEVAR